jgi:hypothetical protein
MADKKDAKYVFRPLRGAKLDTRENLRGRPADQLIEWKTGIPKVMLLPKGHIGRLCRRVASRVNSESQLSTVATRMSSSLNGRPNQLTDAVPLICSDGGQLRDAIHPQKLLINQGFNQNLEFKFPRLGHILSGAWRVRTCTYAK